MKSSGIILVGRLWLEVVTVLGNYKPRLYYYIVKWKPPEVGQVKCNTYGASKGNL